MDNLDMDIFEYLDSASSLVKKLERARDNRQKLSDEVTRLEKHRNAVNKAMTDETAITIKKRREELLAGYKGQLQEAEADLKRVTEKKEAARTAGKKERIARETAGLRKMTGELEAEQKRVLSGAEVSGICGKRWFVHIFLPNRVTDYLFVILSYAVIAYVIPFLLMHFVYKMDDVIKQLLIYMAIGVILVAEYLLIHMKVCIPKKDILEEINQRAVIIKQNKKEIKGIQVAIMSDESEEYYHLDDYNYEIAKCEAVRDEILRKREERLNDFDMVTKKVISDEIRMGYDEELTETDIELEKRKGDLELAENRVRQISAKAMEEYAPRLGQENLTVEKLAEIKALVEEKHLTSLAEAVNMYNGHVC